jgi:hypothetical protein
MTITCFKGFHTAGEKTFDQYPIDGWSKTGSFGPGLYFGDFNCAQVYAENYYPNHQTPPQRFKMDDNPLL